MRYLIGIDLGGTTISCGLLDWDGNLLRKITLPTEVEKGSDEIIAKMARMIQKVISEEGIERSQLAAAGIGMPGFLDPVQGICLFAANLKWENIHVSKTLSQSIGIPVFLNHDVRMYIYGEAITGAASGFDHVFGITIGTGLAAAVVTKGKIYDGGGYLAGEIGHIPMDGVHEACACGLTGCLETIVSATGIARQARQAIEHGQASILQEWMPDLSRIRAVDVSRAYDAGDQVAIDVMNHTGKLLGKALSYFIPMVSPDIIVVGGGAALAGERLFSPMKQALQQHLHPMYLERIQIKPARWIDDGGIRGSALYAKARLKT